MQTVNLNPYTADMEAIARKRKLAEALAAQANQDMPINQMAGGFVIPTPKLSMLTKALQTGLSAWGQKKADDEMRDLTKRQQDDQRSDFAALIKAMQDKGVEARPAIESPPDELGGGPGRAAIEGRSPLAQTPDFMQSLKTPQAQQMALQLAMNQLEPKKLEKLSAGDILVNPSTGKAVFTAPQKSEFGTTPQFEMIDGKMQAVLYGKDGTRRIVGEANPVNQFTTQTANNVADLAQRKAQFEQQFNNLSAEQKAQLQLGYTNAGIRATDVTNQGIVNTYNTGQPMMPPPLAPTAPPVSGAQGGMMPAPRPTGTTLDLNNPGGLRPVGASTGFQKFETPEQGIAAIAGNLKAYGQRGINTIEKIVSTWAPSNENNTKAYINSVSQRLGIPANQPLDMSNPYVLQGLTTAIMLQEQGPRIFAGGNMAATSPQVTQQQGNPALPMKLQNEIAVNNAKLAGELQTKRDFNMQDTGAVIDEARAILTAGNKPPGKGESAAKPTASGVGTALDWAGSMIGVAPKGAAQADKLRAIAGVLTAKVPRMEGPQSDRDVALYKESAGRIGDSTLPIERRLAALATVEQLFRKYDKTSPQPQAPQAQPTNQRRVVDW